MSTVPWICPWCNTPALHESEKKTLCTSCQCSCGAIGLSAPICDTDEIVDDAIGLFEIERSESSVGFTDLQLADIVRSGVDVRGGKLDPDDLFPSHRVIWFRKRDSA